MPDTSGTPHGFVGPDKGSCMADVDGRRCGRARDASVHGDPNTKHAFHAGPNGRCTYGHCGRARGADIHEGRVALLTDRAADTLAPVHAVRTDPPDTPLTPRRAIPWAQLPVVTKILLAAGAGGVAAVFVCGCIALCAVLLRAGGVIG